MEHINNFLGASRRRITVENSPYIEITRNTVKFGPSIYQLRNVTGITVGPLPKKDFPLIWFLVLITVGSTVFSSMSGSLFTVRLLFSLPLFLFAAFLIYSHFNQVQYYGLILSLNSGEDKFFADSDRNFLEKITSAFYDFMEEYPDEILYIDRSNRSVQISGDFQGNLSTGDYNIIS